MSRRFVNIDTYLDEISEYDYSLKDGDKVIFDSNTIIDSIKYTYSEWCFLVRDTDAPDSVFYALYNLYKSKVGDNYIKMFNALNTQYNPLENYSMKEQSSDGHKNSTKTNTDNTTDIKTDNTTNNNYVNAYNSDTESAGTNKSKNTSENTTSNSHDQTFKEEYDNSATAKDLEGNYTNTDDHILTRSGNIGVTTSQQMIESELTLRSKVLIDKYISGFIGMYFTYTPIDE